MRSPSPSRGTGGASRQSTGRWANTTSWRSLRPPMQRPPLRCSFRSARSEIYLHQVTRLPRRRKLACNRIDRDPALRPRNGSGRPDAKAVAVGIAQHDVATPRVVLDLDAEIVRDRIDVLDEEIHERSWPRVALVLREVEPHVAPCDEHTPACPAQSGARRPCRTPGADTTRRPGPRR